MITVLFGGSRPNGNTAQLTKFALQGLDYQWIDVTQHRFKPIRDVRHIEES
ncbi:flavodoxin family protein, partial [Staphylococcus aureus]|nr:flavodoxin family protein [Staphylococcus aureus]